jgi:roadblock/LC7 domain-containing protein
MRSTQRTPKRRRPGASALIAPALLLAALTFSGCATREIAWSPDGKSIAYAVAGELRTYNVETQQSRQIPIGEVGASLPAWSPDGKLIAFYGATGAPEDMRVALRTVDPSSGIARTLASDVWRMPTTFAGTIQVRWGTQRVEAVQYAQDGWPAIAATAASISWSPDATRLAWTSSSQRGVTLNVTDCASGISNSIIEPVGVVFAASWSPDGKQLAYALLPWGQLVSSESPQKASHDDEPQSLWLYDFDSGGRTRICDLPRNGLVTETRLQWSPDSRQIGFIRQRGDGLADGCIVDARPDANVRPELRGISAAAAWSPDLSGVAFVEERGENEAVVIFRGMKPITRKVIGVLHIPAVDIFASPEKAETEESGVGSRYSMPEFSPDGRYVALRAGERLSDLRIAVFRVQ